MQIYAKNAPKYIWRPGSALTRWGQLIPSPDPLVAMRRPTSKLEEGERKEYGGRKESGKGKGGLVGRLTFPFFTEVGYIGDKWKKEKRERGKNRPFSALQLQAQFGFNSALPISYA